MLEGEAGGAPEASVLAEVRVVADHDFYDFEAKYLDDSCEYDIPADLPDKVTRQVQEYAVRAFTALDCAGLARVDFFVTPELDVYLNEINTMPGLHPDVDVPADVGGLRPGVPEAGQPPDPHRPAARRRPALSHPAQERQPAEPPGPARRASGGAGSGQRWQPDGMAPPEGTVATIVLEMVGSHCNGCS